MPTPEFPDPISVHIVNAFIHDQSGGNPAGVVLNADSFTTEQKLFIARQIKLSETAFISKSSAASVKIEFFTPTRQIAHCGHATVAAFSLCRSLGLLEDGIHTKESIEGILTVTLKDGFVFLHQTPIQYHHLSESDDIRQRALDSLGISGRELLPGAPLTVGRAGNAFLLVPLKEETGLRALRPQMELIQALSEELGLVGFYPFIIHPRGHEFTASARMFAPRYGIAEESATGTAAGPLGCYLHDVLKLQPDIYRVQQGRHMENPSPSLLMVQVEATKNAGSAARVGGQGARTGTVGMRF